MMFWRGALQSYILPLLSSLNKMYAIPNSVQPKLRFGVVVYTRSTVSPPVVTNSYFMPLEKMMKEWQDNPIEYGLGATNRASESGMAVLEGLVAAVEMCDILSSETLKQTRRAHSNTTTPPTAPPIFRIILIGSDPPGGPKTPMYNNNPELDDVTLDTLPAELIKRNIKITFVLPYDIPAFRELFGKMEDPQEDPWFKTSPNHVLLLSGFQRSAESPTQKRPVPSTPGDTNDPNKRSKVATSPAIPSKPPPQTAIPTQDQKLSADPPATIVETPQQRTNPTSLISQATAQQEYQRLLREGAQARINAIGSHTVATANMPPPATVSSPSKNIVETPSSRPVPSAGQNATGQALTSTDGAEQTNTANPAPVASSSVAMTKSASNPSHGQAAEAPINRPQSQPQNATFQSQQPPSVVREGHSRSQSTNLPPSHQGVLNQMASLTATPTMRDSPKVQSSPQPPGSTPMNHHRAASQAGSTSGTHPSPSINNNSSPKRGEGQPAMNPLLGGRPTGHNPASSAVLAHLETMSQTNSRLLQAQAQAQAAGAGLAMGSSAEAIAQQQKVFAGRMTQEGLMNPGLGNPQPLESSGTWHGILAFTLFDGAGVKREFRCHVTAKPGPGGAQRAPPFVVFPPNLPFSLDDFRIYDLQDFSKVIKSNGIPLCLFEPNPPPSKNPDDVKRNENVFTMLVREFINQKAGAAITFQVPAGPPGTGLFIFPPAPGNPRLLLGAAFLTQPIPPLSKLAHPMLMNQGIQRPPFGVQQTTSIDATMNPHMFNPNNAQALRNLIIQQQLFQRQGQPPSMQQAQAGQPFGGLGTLSGAGLGNVPGITVPPLMGQSINMQAQTQNRLLGGGMGMGTGVGLPDGAGGYPNAAGPSSINFAAALQRAQQMGSLNGIPGIGGNPAAMNLGMNLPGGMANFPGLQQGMNLGMGGVPNLPLAGLTPEFIRAMMPHGQPGMGGPATHDLRRPSWTPNSRLFAKSGYRVALLARNPDHLKSLSESIKSDGGEAAPFPIDSYTHESMPGVFSSIKSTWPDADIRAAVWNAGLGTWKSFLDVTEKDIRESLDINVVGAFAFARESILAFKDLDLNEKGKRGTLIFTGATASLRGNTNTSVIAAGKHGLRALSNSLAKEFGKQNIHVAHAIMDGVIRTGQSKSYFPEDKLNDPDAMLSPDSIANAYLYLTDQDRSAMTWELDLRPAHEKCRLFAKSGYRVALLARGADSLKSLADSIKAEGGEAAPFPIQTYNQANLKPVFESIKQTWPDSEIRVTVWNAGAGIFKRFLDTTEEDIQLSVNTNIVGAFAFARESISTFQSNELNDIGKRGTLIFTGATASIRGNVTTSAFAAGKHGLRALSQSLAKEFGKENIHVAHAIIDGGILTDLTKKSFLADKVDDLDARLTPEGIANAYLFLTNQERSTFTWELDLRPAHEKW
ncbi:hypothetical protein FRB99_006124 [Tulasnella sp. 403]|nr:hypothetical protein FRB99_006124 [Tulasnella sp. 403]